MPDFRYDPPTVENLPEYFAQLEAHDMKLDADPQFMALEAAANAVTAAQASFEAIVGLMAPRIEKLRRAMKNNEFPLE